jgi:propanol-preferring alcohol dehydrogenase
MPYDILWGERVIRSVANLTRRDGVELMDIAARVPLEITVEPMPLSETNEALSRLREGRLTGAAVILPPTCTACGC